MPGRACCLGARRLVAQNPAVAGPDTDRSTYFSGNETGYKTIALGGGFVLRSRNVLRRGRQV
jgi:hypothetical protein